MAPHNTRMHVVCTETGLHLITTAASDWQLRDTGNDAFWARLVTTAPHLKEISQPERYILNASNFPEKQCAETLAAPSLVKPRELDCLCLYNGQPVHRSRVGPSKRAQKRATLWQLAVREVGHLATDHGTDTFLNALLLQI